MIHPGFCLSLEREMEMEDMASFWSYQEIIDELQNKLMTSSFDLESARMAAKMDKIKNQEITEQLIQVLKKVRQERDEARYHLQKLLKEFSSPIIPIESVPPLQPRLLTGIIPPKNTNVINKIATKSKIWTNKVSSEASKIEDLVKGKPLPRKGRLLQAVIEAGPLLQTLIVAGPLPQWRNPPPQQASLVPSNPNVEGEHDFIVNSRSAITRSSPVLNFERGSGSRLKSGHSITSGTDSRLVHKQSQNGRRKRLS